MTKNLFATCLNHRSTSLVLIASGIVGFSSSSFASYEATAYGGSFGEGGIIGYTTTPGDVSYSYDYSYAGDPVVKSSVTTFTSSPVASVSYAGTVSNPVGQGFMQGGGGMKYSFEVAAQPFTNVPIDFSGLYSSYQEAAGWAAQTSFLIQTVNSGLLAYSYFSSTLAGDCSAPICLQYYTVNNPTYTSTQSDVFHVNGSFEGTLDMLTGADGKAIGFVQFGVGVNINVLAGSASAAAFIDPHLEIDAAFLTANPGTTLTITPGVGNEISAVPDISVVPEPSTYALMLAGLAAMTVRARRRGVRHDESAIAPEWRVH